METDHVGRFLNPDGGYLDIDGKTISGCTSYKGITAMQHDNAFDTFEKLIRLTRPARILEIGTAAGGLCLFLRQILNEIGLESTPIKTFDIYDCTTHRVLERENNLEVIYKNLFCQNYLSLEKPELIQEYIQSDGLTLVLCDGGNKVGEFNLLSNYIKEGDFIMAHDYADNRENFDTNFNRKIWNWHEIQDSNINESCLRNNLKSYNKEIFDSVVWVCKIK
jgi:hypothetical protein